METISIWGIKIDPLSKLQIVSSVHSMLDAGRRGIHITGVNPETIVNAASVPALRDAILDSDIVNVDNMLVLLRLKLCGYKVPERAATPDVFALLLEGAQKRGESVFFLGAEKDVLERMVEKVSASYPELRIAGYHDGYYSEAEEPSIVGMIRDACPTYLFLGLPTPQKETFIMKYKHTLGVGLLYGVGGAFDVWGGKVKRAPRWACRIGLEGILRVLQNPKNYGRRVFVYYPSFFRIKR